MNNQWLRATLMRVLAFFPFASAYLALLPLVARDRPGAQLGAQSGAIPPMSHAKPLVRPFTTIARPMQEGLAFRSKGSMVGVSDTALSA